MGGRTWFIYWYESRIHFHTRKEDVDGWVPCSVFDNIILQPPTAAVVCCRQGRLLLLLTVGFYVLCSTTLFCSHTPHDVRILPPTGSQVQTHTCCGACIIPGTWYVTRRRVIQIQGAYVVIYSGDVPPPPRHSRPHNIWSAAVCRLGIIILSFKGISYQARITQV